ncbi:CTP:phosphocholine cytidylyltransferase [Lachnospiraceae bacterium C7]|nr:CTP:phosphocholine cytidylyltransferase [Lachnospiraceae bacterium C7]
MYNVDNAVIMAAGVSSRCIPLSYEKPKALIDVNGFVVIERQIKQLKEAGIKDIYVVTGYKSGQLQYLKDKFGVKLIQNEEFNEKDNISSIWVVKDILKNTYICSVDNYFPDNPFKNEENDSFYATVYKENVKDDWSIEVGLGDYISKIEKGGKNSYVLCGHAFWNEEFSKKFVEIMEKEYNLPETASKPWEEVYGEHIAELKLKNKEYDKEEIYKFDSLQDLREIDKSYRFDTKSKILKKIAISLGKAESQIENIVPQKENSHNVSGFLFEVDGRKYEYIYEKQKFNPIK